MNVIITHKDETGNIVFTMDQEAAGELYYALVVAKVKNDSEIKMFEKYPEITRGIRKQAEKFNFLLKQLRPNLWY